MARITKDDVDLEDLAQRVQNLPAELYDMVLEYTFTADEERIEITLAYKPPAQLQVSRATRELFAQDYYTTTRFVVPVWAHPMVVDRFVTSLSMAHVKLLLESRSLFLQTG